MIRKSAKDGFLKRKLSDTSWLKHESMGQLDKALSKLKPVPDFGSLKLWLHQKAIFLILNTLQRFMLHVDMGGGKTLISLLLLKYRKQCGGNTKAIVFAPYITSIATWIDEVAERAPELVCVPLLGTTKENLHNLQHAEGDIFVISYQSAVAMVSQKYPAKKRGKKKFEWNFKAADIRKYFSRFDMLVMDEIHKCREVSSLTYRMCRAISAQCTWVVGLTGTPFNKNPLELWPQFYLVDFGETLGPTFGLFREVFATLKINYWGGFEYKFNKKLLPELQQIIKHSSISYAITDLHDMPPRKWVPIKIKSNIGQAGYVKAALERMRDAAANTSGSQKLQAVQSNYMQLRQLSSGFMTLKGDDSSSLQVKFEDNPKLDTLIDLIDALPAGRKMVVFHHFIYTNKLISERLTELKIGHARIWSGQRDPIGELKRFKQSKTCQVLVLNDKIGSSSLNLQFANYACFFEQPESAIDRQQAERRIWRPGQVNPVTYYDLFIKGTYDEAMFKSNQAGENLLKKLLRGAK